MHSNAHTVSLTINNLDTWKTLEVEHHFSVKNVLFLLTFIHTEMMSILHSSSKFFIFARFKNSRNRNEYLFSHLVKNRHRLFLEFVPLVFIRPT